MSENRLVYWNTKKKKISITGVPLCVYVSERGLAELSIQRAAKRKLLAGVFTAVFADES